MFFWSQYPKLIISTCNQYKRRMRYFILTFPYRASLIAQLVKNLPAMKETPVQFLGQEDPLEKGEATHSSILGLPLWLSW